MSQYDPSETMRDEKQRSFPELTVIQSVSWAKHTVGQRILTSFVYLTFLISSMNSRP